MLLWGLLSRAGSISRGCLLDSCLADLGAWSSLSPVTQHRNGCVNVLLANCWIVRAEVFPGIEGPSHAAVPSFGCEACEVSQAEISPCQHSVLVHRVKADIPDDQT